MITLNDFTNNFMGISNNLTISELRMLYLLITEPNVKNITQEEFGDKIGADRRTIISGNKKLLRYGYITGKNRPQKQRMKSENNFTIQKSNSKNNLENNNEIVTEEVTIKEQPQADIFLNQDYNDLIAKFYISKDKNIIMHLFEIYPEKYLEILSDIQSCLTDNIDQLANKYGFEEELRIIRISNEQIKILEKSKRYKWDAPLGLEYAYFDRYQNNRKNAAMRIVRKALIHFPFHFNSFYDHIRSYKYEDSDEIVKAMKIEIYGTENLPSIIKSQ